MSQYSWTNQRMGALRTDWVSHLLLVIPNCPYPLLGRDLLAMVGAQITFDKDKVTLTDQTGQPTQVLTLQLEDKYRLYLKPPPTWPDINS